MKHLKRCRWLVLVSFLFTYDVFAATKMQFREFAVEQLDEIVMRQVAREFEVLRRDGSRYVVLVPTHKMTAFLKLAPYAELLPDTESMDVESPAGYRDFAAVEETLKKIAADFPQIAQLETYGQSTEGRPLYLLKISDNVAVDEADEPRMLLDAATHGDEIITTEVILRLIEELVHGYGSDTRLTNIVNQNAIYVAPVVNPDGFVQRQRYADGVDPNRQYPYPEKPDRHSIGIIQSLMDLFAKHQFKSSITFHAFGELVMYPWGYTHEPIRSEADRSDFAALADRMAEHNHYTAGPIADVIYIAEGSSADYYYWKYQTKAIAVELTRSKAPASSQIPGVVDDAREMTWRFLEHFVN